MTPVQQHGAAFESFFAEYSQFDDAGKERFDARFEQQFGADFAALWAAWRVGREH